MTNDEIMRVAREARLPACHLTHPKALARFAKLIAAQKQNEVDRLQRIIDSRPAINAGLPQSYIEWSGSIYAMEMFHAQEQQQ